MSVRCERVIDKGGMTVREWQAKKERLFVLWMEIQFAKRVPFLNYHHFKKSEHTEPFIPYVAFYNFAREIRSRIYVGYVAAAYWKIVCIKASNRFEFR